MNVRITQIDGALPNLALMKLGAWHLAKGDNVSYTRAVERDLFEPEWGMVYGSAIFDFSRSRLERFSKNFPSAVIGGTGSGSLSNVEQIIGEFSGVDYSGHPEFKESLGFTQRGCRLSCKFCVVPKKEGKPNSVATIAQIWRGDGHPKKLHLLDNDFFGNTEWRERIAEIRNGEFRVCLSQGINVRLINDESASALATIEYRDTKFSKRRLYTAWDNLGDERVFFRGVETLERNGVPPQHLMAYMLVGYDPLETWDRIWHRFNAMVARGIMPYPMVYNRRRRDLLAFQRWAITGLYRFVKWNEYKRETRTDESTESFLRAIAGVKP